MMESERGNLGEGIYLNNKNISRSLKVKKVIQRRDLDTL